MKTIYVKPWDGCNLKCDMCYNAQMERPEKMDAFMLDTVYDHIHELLDYHRKEGILVHLHGGEPLLANNEAVREFCYKVQNLCRTTNVKLTVTTNLTYKLDEIKLDILNTMSPYRGFKHFIQTSWDYGTIRWKNPEERRLFEDNVTYLKSRGFGIQGTVCLTKPLIDAYIGREGELLDKLSELFHVINFERLTQNGNLLQHPELVPSWFEVDEFMLGIWKAYSAPEHFIRPWNPPIPILDDIVYSCLNLNKWLGCRARKCSKNVETINPDGSTASCPNVAHQPTGHLTEKAVGDKRMDKYINLTIPITEELVQKPICLACDVFHICHGDCYQLVKSSSFMECHGLRETIRAIREDLKERGYLRMKYAELKEDKYDRFTVY